MKIAPGDSNVASTPCSNQPPAVEASRFWCSQLAGQSQLPEINSAYVNERERWFGASSYNEKVTLLLGQFPNALLLA